MTDQPITPNVPAQEVPVQTQQTTLPESSTALAPPKREIKISLGNEVPEFIAKSESREGTEGLERFIRPKFLKIAQSTGDFRRDNNLQEGDVRKMPINQHFMSVGESKLVTPIFKWFQYELWYHYKAKEKNPVKDRSLDPQSELAQVCLGPKENWEIPDDKHPGLVLTHKENICFILYVHDTDELVAVNFVGGEHKTGRNFAEMIQQRKSDLYTGVYEMTVGAHTGNGNTWMGFNFNPAGWIATPEDKEALRAMYLMQKDAYDRQLLYVDEHEVEGADTDDLDAAMNGDPASSF